MAASLSSLPPQTRKQIKRQLHDSSASCCNLWCSTIVVSLLWGLANVYILIYGSNSLSELESAGELVQDGNWCRLVNSDSWYGYTSYYGDCDALLALYKGMIALSSIALVAMLIAISGTCSFRRRVVLGFAIFLFIHLLICIILMARDSWATVLALSSVPSVILNVMVITLYCKLTKINSQRSMVHQVPLFASNHNHDKNQNLNYNANVYVVNEQVSEWLNKLGLPEYHDLFVQHGIEDVDTILTLTNEELIQIGIHKMGHRKKMMFCIQQSGKHQEGGETEC